MMARKASHLPMNEYRGDNSLVFSAALVAIAMLYAIQKLYALEYAVSDENIYFYLASAMAHGRVPYRDFFHPHPHPPLHLYPLALVCKVQGGFSLLPARVLSGGAILLAGILIARGQRRSSAAMGLIACALFLGSFDVLRVSTHYVGANLAAFWVALGLERLARVRDRQAALAFSLGGFTLLNALPAAIGAILVVALVDRARGMRLAGVGILITLVLNAIAVALFGTAYLEQVYLFHLAKAATSGQSLDVVQSVIYSNGLLLGTACLGLVALILGRESEDIGSDANSEQASAGLRSEISSRLPLYVAIGAALGSGVFLAASNRIFIYYFQVFFVCIAPLAGYGIVALFRAVRAATAVDGLARTERREAQQAAAIMLFVLVASQLAGGLRTPDASPVATAHPWRGSGFKFLDALIEPVLWSETEISGRAAWGLTRYLWHEADSFTSASLLAGEVSSRCGPDETLFGDSTATPLVALLADRRLVLGEADTNWQRFSTDERATSHFLVALRADPPCAVLFRSNHGLFRLTVFRDWLNQHYRSVIEMSNRIETRHFKLYLRTNPDTETALR